SATNFSPLPFTGLPLRARPLLQPALPADTPAASARSRWLGLGLAVLGALFPLGLAYGPRSSNPAGVAARFNWALSYLLQERGLDHALGVLFSHLWLPRELKD